MMKAANRRAAAVLRLLEFTDSAFPVGTFSFSSGLETASFLGLVHDVASLEEYTRDVALQAAFTDGVAALHAHRSRLREDYGGILEADMQTMLCKMNYEARLMSCRMGKKLAELSEHVFSDSFMARWKEDIVQGRSAGTYPVAQGLIFASCGISELELFCSHQYGAASMVLSAALRLVRVSHYDTQRILFRMADDMDALYERVRGYGLEDMNTFAPQIDILASLHEKGAQRMFMN